MTTIELVQLLATIVAIALLAWLVWNARGAGARLGGDVARETRLELERAQTATRDELRHARESLQGELRQSRDSLQSELRLSRESLQGDLRQSREETAAELRKAREEALVAQTELRRDLDAKLERVRATLDERVKELQTGNEQKLEQMRKTVDEQLQSTLEKRLGESFKLVSDRLEQVHKGLGEMQTLASGVGDLKRVLTNVKARGTWAEVQLGALLEQVLTADQFDRNVAVRPGAAERVEFAVRLPGPRDDPSRPVWLPIDSKFPQEDWLRLQEASERADAEATKQATEALGRAVRAAAKDIAGKYVDPPHSTDFAILFLATEGLYAEVLRQPAILEDVQQLRVMLAGPTTLVAMLSSLRMGFQTLAIEQRAHEVWRVLGAVKTEFGKFGGVLDKVKRQLETASRTIDDTGVRTRAIERRLRDVSELPADESASVLLLDGTTEWGVAEPPGDDA